MILSAFALAVGLLGRAPADAATYHLRFVLVHEHSPAVEQGARDFAARVENETGGDVSVEVLGRDEYGKRYRGGKRSGMWTVQSDAASGKVEIVQTYTHLLSVYAPSLRILGLPYAFRDYDHTEAVLDGQIGRELMHSLDASSPLHALGFTYSGGFGVFATTKQEMHSPRDLEGLRIFMMGGPITSAIAGRLGFETWSGPPEAFGPLAQAGLLDGLETVYSCFAGYGDDRYAKVVTETYHFLGTTMIVINKKAFEALPERYRTIVERAAREAAAKERRESIALNAELRARLIKEGVKIVTPTAQERRALEEALEPVSAELGRTFGPGLLERIRKTR
ncbi:MAG: TRAP transporter substrate-binding protein DctP [Elusimicrobia bacterium]|nr:TRAP transporter substrate-binding protein DctP [Elusimicrobiota bacterium]